MDTPSDLLRRFSTSRWRWFSFFLRCNSRFTSPLSLARHSYASTLIFFGSAFIQQVALLIWRAIYDAFSSISDILLRLTHITSAVFPSISAIFSAILQEAIIRTSAIFSLSSASCSWWWKRTTMGHNSKLCCTFVCLTKKAPITETIQPLPYWGRYCVPQSILIALLALELCKPEDSGYVSSWCQFCIDLYACSKCSLSMVATNYEVNLHYLFIFLPLRTSYMIDQRWYDSQPVYTIS